MQTRSICYLAMTIAAADMTALTNNAETVRLLYLCYFTLLYVSRISWEIGFGQMDSKSYISIQLIAYPHCYHSHHHRQSRTTQTFPRLTSFTSDFMLPAYIICCSGLQPDAANMQTQITHIQHDMTHMLKS